MKNNIMSAALGLALGISASIAQAETVLRVGSVAPSKSPWGAWITEAAQKLEEVSGGELKLNLLLDGQIGDEVTMTRQAMKGRLDMIYVSNDPLAVVMPEMELTVTPYLYDSVEQGSCVTNEHLAGIMGPLMATNGLVPITWMEVGHTILFSREPIRTPDQMKGVKIRVANGVIKRDWMASLGTTPSPLNVADTVPALQTGALDAVNLPVVYGIAVGIPKLAPNVTLTRHFRITGALAISERSWNKLSDQEKEWLMSVAPMGAKLSSMILGAENALLGQIKEAGVNVIELSDDEMAAWRASAADAPEKAVGAVGGQAAEIMEKLQAAKAACGN
ncbi:TRAP transporter substrate-binding protein DctP [Thalassovita sp.]|uniref:TRAP transporter substrate-binding protein n=1 Tax=Thalassovita sp. TaxID=1979401 RepID=UPI0029DE8431|nr:TRAP transporter substrate-binding protein DctP [Thalassovita sp.]